MQEKKRKFIGFSSWEITRFEWIVKRLLLFCTQGRFYSFRFNEFIRHLTHIIFTLNYFKRIQDLISIILAILSVSNIKYMRVSPLTNTEKMHNFRWKLFRKMFNFAYLVFHYSRYSSNFLAHFFSNRSKSKTRKWNYIEFNPLYLYRKKPTIASSFFLINTWNSSNDYFLWTISFRTILKKNWR